VKTAGSVTDTTAHTSCTGGSPAVLFESAYCDSAGSSSSDPSFRSDRIRSCTAAVARARSVTSRPIIRTVQPAANTMAAASGSAQMLYSAAVQERMRSFGKLGSELMLPALAQYADSNDSAGEPPVHDVCAVVSVTDPSVFTYTPALVQVETTGTWTSGMTVTDFEATGRPNALVATDIDADKFWDVVLGTYESLAGSLDQRS
jgi:hypothetical protein